MSDDTEYQFEIYCDGVVIGMETPPEVLELIKAFYPGSWKEYADQDEWIQGTVTDFVGHGGRRKIIRQFLDELLNGTYSNKHIANVWREASPSYEFTEGGHRWMLNKIRMAL